MRILVVDHSGRGHAFADLFSRTSTSARIDYAPGCAAIATPRVTSHPELALADPGAMVEFARRERIDVAFVANTMALANGFVDAFRAGGVPVIGPDREACRLETSKSYTKELCRRYGIPVADFAVFDGAAEAAEHVRRSPHPLVVKGDGLCAGNGSFVCDGADDALAAIDRLMVERAFGAAGDRVVIERRLFGIELSYYALLDGESYLVLPMAIDYPKSDDGNAGITCGGVGAFAPHPLESPDLVERVRAQLLEPIVRCIAAEGLRYTGILYLGCMLVGDQAYLLEINVRMGDPEAEVALPRIETDFAALCEAVLERRLPRAPIATNALTFCDVVLGQGRTRQIGEKGRSKGWYVGWPKGRFGRHYPITGLERVDPATAKVFLGEASVLPGKGLVSDGGRVLHVVGIGETLAEASDNAYRNVGRIHFEGMRYRTDIGRTMPQPGLVAAVEEGAVR